MSSVEINIDGLKEFADKVREAGESGFRKFCEGLLEDVGWEILAIFQEEIEKSGSIDTGTLFDSFEKDAKGNVWKLNEPGLEIEVGTEIYYAAWVNDGHWTNPQGVERRWVPGYWEGSHFRYEPGAPTGMSLKQQWVEGKHYYESAIRAIELMLPRYLEQAFEDWLDEFFGG